MNFDLNDLPDLDLLDPQSLKDLYAQLEGLYADVELQEPEDEDSDDYEAWLDDLDWIEDLMEEIEERLED